MTCTTDGCNEQARARSMCVRHYNAWHYAAHAVTKSADRPCRGCGAVISTRDSRRYCSPACRSIALRADTAAARAAIVKACPTCEADFSPAKSLRQVYCSRRCASKASRDVSSQVCVHEDCGRPVRAKGLCHMHWRRQARAEGRESNPDWNDRRRDNYHRRRALKAGTAAESINHREVYERDGWMCGLCAEPVDGSLAWPDPRSASLDHVTPLSLGGAHVLANVQLAHLGCNVEKGARVPA